MNAKTVTLTDNETGKQIELEVLEPTIGPPTINISSLYKDMGFFTFDPGFMSTASCESAITYMCGETGVLAYRGYPIEQLAKNSNYLETCYLLFYGELPYNKAFNEFTDMICQHTMIHEALKKFYDGFRRDAHPMAIMVGVTGALSAFYNDHCDIRNSYDREVVAHRLIAKMPTIAAWSYRYANGLPFVYPDASLNYTENFLHMMFSVPSKPYKVKPIHAKALDLIMLLHADHEQNASTSTVRLSGSSEANPYAAVAAGIATLWGPAHGGANEAVIQMLQDIVNSDNSISDYVKRAKDKNDTFRLMGFGHRVYKTYDPRAKLIREVCHEILEHHSGDTQLEKILDVAMTLEKIALEDEYFISRNLYPNVDFYSGIIFLAIGIPMNMFTVIFSMSRTIGWISHWNEMMQADQLRIGRPRQLYTGKPIRSYPEAKE